ncbi:MAG TPA: hypothetical protein VK996_01805 [Ramlibacter sp.]|nr:hypothetical protein [Ramlibacter sp.]
MKLSLAALGCALALTGATALAEQSNTGPTFTDKVKEAARDIGEKTKETAQKVRQKAKQTAEKARKSDDAGHDTKSAGDTGSTTAARQMQRKADADLKAAKAKCDAMEDKSQKAVCQKQAAAAHANAEVKIEKAKAAGNTSTMGAGKSSQ